MIDPIRCELEGKYLYAKDELERTLASVLLEAYDCGELTVYREKHTDELLFALTEPAQ